MSLIKQVLNLGDGNSSKYKSAEFEDGISTTDGDYEIVFVTVKDNSDVMNVKDKIREDKIVFMEVSNTANLPPERIVEDVKPTVDKFNGEMAYWDDHNVIISPESVSINKTRQ